MTGLSAQFRPGLSGTFGANRQGSGARVAVGKNLSNATSVKANFSMTTSHGAKFVAGRNTQKGNHVYNYERMRQSASRTNRSAYTPRSAEIPASYSQTNLNTNYNVGSNTSTLNNILTGIQMLNSSGLGGIVSGLFSSGNVTTTAGQALDNVASSLGSGASVLSSVSDGGVATSISNMQSADNSSDLRQAIAGADAQMSSLSYVTTDDAQTKFEQAKADVKTLEGEVKSATTERDKAKEEVTNAKNGVQSQTTVRDSKKQALANAMTKQNQCSAAYAQAHANLISAQATYENTPATITLPDGSTQPNPAKAAAEKAFNAAKEAEEKAKTDLDKANEAKVTADENLEKAENELKAAQEKLDNAQSTQNKAETTLKEKQDALDKKQAELDKKQAEVDKFKQDKQDYETLNKEIGKQKERLTKLEQKELTQYEKLGNKIDGKQSDIDKRAGKIDASDGMNIAEKIRQRKNEKAETKMEEMNDQKAQLQDNTYKTQLLADNTNVQIGNNGQELRMGTLPSGKPVYFIGTLEVSEQEFTAAGGSLS